MWILINWYIHDGRDILPINDKEGDELPKQFKSGEEAREWGLKNLNGEFREIEI